VNGETATTWVIANVIFKSVLTVGGGEVNRIEALKSEGVQDWFRPPSVELTDRSIRQNNHSTSDPSMD